MADREVDPWRWIVLRPSVCRPAGYVMAKTVAYYLSRATQARRLAEGCTDIRLRDDLLRVAKQFEEEARILKERQENPT